MTITTAKHDIDALRIEIARRPDDYVCMREWLLRLLDIHSAVIAELERIDMTAHRAADTASCLANGIAPD